MICFGHYQLRYACATDHNIFHKLKCGYIVLCSILVVKFPFVFKWHACDISYPYPQYIITLVILPTVIYN